MTQLAVIPDEAPSIIFSFCSRSNRWENACGHHFMNSIVFSQPLLQFTAKVLAAGIPKVISIFSSINGITVIANLESMKSVPFV